MSNDLVTRIAAVLKASPGDRALLERLVRSPTTPQRVARRSRIVLLALRADSIGELAARAGVSRETVKLWLGRFESGGVDALLRDAPGRGRRAALDPRQFLYQLRAQGLLGPDGLPVSLRKAAAALGVSSSAIWRALRRPTGDG